MLATRLFCGTLSARLESRVQAYRSKRLAQINALLNQFVAVHESEEERVRDLQAFAEKQTPELVALEAEAERLREDLLVDSHLFKNRFKRWESTSKSTFSRTASTGTRSVAGGWVC